MTTYPAGRPRVTVSSTKPPRDALCKTYRLVLLAAAILLTSSLALSQAAPKITGVDPGMGKVNDNVTVSGNNLEKTSVAAIFLSDDKTDYKATIVEQAADKIVMKVPQVKPGSYNVSIQVGNGILIEPVRFTVQ
jgi:hypothetical protein